MDNANKQKNITILENMINAHFEKFKIFNNTSNILNTSNTTINMTSNLNGQDNITILENMINTHFKKLEKFKIKINNIIINNFYLESTKQIIDLVTDLSTCNYQNQNKYYNILVLNKIYYEFESLYSKCSKFKKLSFLLDINKDLNNYDIKLDTLLQDVGQFLETTINQWIVNKFNLIVKIDEININLPSLINLLQIIKPSDSNKSYYKPNKNNMYIFNNISELNNYIKYAIKYDYTLLKYLPLLKSNEELALIAIKDSDAYDLLDTKLQNNTDFVLKAINVNSKLCEKIAIANKNLIEEKIIISNCDQKYKYSFSNWK